MTAVRADSGPWLVSSVTRRPSSASALTRAPVLISGTPAASAASATSAAVTADSGSRSAGPSTRTPGNRALASAADSSSVGAPAAVMASRTAARRRS